MSAAERHRVDLQSFMPLIGVPIVTDPYMVDRWQYRFPRSKRARIRRKWAKRPQNYRETPSKKAIVIGGRWIMHPDTLETLKRHLEKCT